MPKYKFSVGDQVFLLRSRQNDDGDIFRTNLGEIIDLHDINQSPYCYETVFERRDMESESRRMLQVYRDLHWEQIGLVSDSRDYRLNQVVIYDPDLLGETRVGEEYAYLAFVKMKIKL